jgi:hypothetical protein
MKRRGLILAVIGMLLLAGWALHRVGWLSRSGEEVTPARADRAKSASPLATPAGWRYRQNQPHHWRYIMLRK